MVIHTEHSAKICYKVHNFLTDKETWSYIVNTEQRFFRSTVCVVQKLHC